MSGELDRLHTMVPPHTGRYAHGEPDDVDTYLRRLAAHLAAAEDLGVEGMLVYNFPAALDPWLVAWDVLAASRSVAPILGLLPFAEEVSAVSRRLRGLRYRFGRTPYLNVVAGASRAQRDRHGVGDDRKLARAAVAGFIDDLRATGDAGPARIYTPLSSMEREIPVAGDAVLTMAKPRERLRPEIEAAGGRSVAMLVGIVARPTAGEARAVAGRDFAPDRRTDIAVRMQMADNASSQHRTNHNLASSGEWHDECLWYGARGVGADAPKLVGSYGEVAAALRTYFAAGVRELIVDLPPSTGEYDHVARALTAAGWSPARRWPRSG